MGGRHAAVMPALPEDSGDFFPSRFPSDSMDIDADDQESASTTMGSAERASPSPGDPRERSSSDTSTIQNGKRSPEDDAGGTHMRAPIRTPPSSGIPSSMASILNAYPSEDSSHSPRRLSRSPPITTTERRSPATPRETERSHPSN